MRCRRSAAALKLVTRLGRNHFGSPDSQSDGDAQEWGTRPSLQAGNALSTTARKGTVPRSRQGEGNNRQSLEPIWEIGTSGTAAVQILQIYLLSLCQLAFFESFCRVLEWEGWEMCTNHGEYYPDIVSLILILKLSILFPYSRRIVELACGLGHSCSLFPLASFPWGFSRLGSNDIIIQYKYCVICTLSLIIFFSLGFFNRSFNEAYV
jgi:hypothetical protein